MKKMMNKGKKQITIFGEFFFSLRLLLVAAARCMLSGVEGDREHEICSQEALFILPTSLLEP